MRLFVFFFFFFALILVKTELLGLLVVRIHRLLQIGAPARLCSPGEGAWTGPRPHPLRLSSCHPCSEDQGRDSPETQLEKEFEKGLGERTRFCRPEPRETLVGNSIGVCTESNHSSVANEGVSVKK